MAANELGIQLENVIRLLRPVIEKRVLLRSAHIHKKHREHYERRTYKVTMEFKHLTGSTADTFLEYVERNLPEGVAMQVDRHIIERLPSHLVPPASEETTTSIKT
ncbi:28S ribosomal protein S10-like protein [Leptotrombidium deliense]|uniref:Small ribosomal subunit protein uS10m n=1 Tax=Leptotrombidium deliense TaxID=299467 RepID=A0A443RUL4_9ACAR|nr:28S ribosomal protein S10-like protein [Leptotrombidium deliense]